MKTDKHLALHEAIATMDLPEQKKTAVDIHDLRWLGRNMALNNPDHPQLAEARGLLGALGISFVM